MSSEIVKGSFFEMKVDYFSSQISLDSLETLAKGTLCFDLRKVSLNVAVVASRDEPRLCKAPE